MAENPLLPNRRLQELHALMIRCRELDHKNRLSNSIAREAVLAATAVQLEAGDILFAMDGDTTVAALALDNHRSSKAKKSTTVVAKAKGIAAGLYVPFCAGLAQGLKVTKTRGAVVAITPTSTTLGEWQETLAYAQELELPFILIFLDTPKTGRGRRAAVRPTLAGIVKLSKRSHIPMLTVDGEDAVAMYRVMQESLLRARTLDGPSIVWCSLESSAKQKKSKSIAHMEQYLASRNLKTLKN